MHISKGRIKKIKDNNFVLSKAYDFIQGILYWFLNYIVSSIPIWNLRKLFYKMYGVKIGHNARIGLHTKVIRPSRIKIGDRTIINEFCYIDGRGGLTIGHDSSISIYTKIITASHNADSSQFSYIENGTIIGDNVWTGCAAIILDGSFVEEGCIIGAGAVLKGKTEPYGIYVGNPAKKIRNRAGKFSYKLDFHPFFK